MMSLCRECEIVKSKYIALESSESSGLTRTVAQCGERSNYIRRRAKQVDDKRERFSDSRRASGSQKLTEEDAAGCTVPSEIQKQRLHDGTMFIPQFYFLRREEDTEMSAGLRCNNKKPALNRRQGEFTMTGKENSFFLRENKKKCLFISKVRADGHQ